MWEGEQKQLYFLSEDLARAAELQVGLTVCRVHWDEILRGYNRCSVPREYHLHGLRKQRIPARLYAVLDAIGTTYHGYKPGTRWRHKCYTTVDKETRFTSHPDNKPPVSRTINNKHRLNITDTLVRTPCIAARSFGISLPEN